MVGPAVKILHDCRQDSLALHELLDTCLVHVFDTSAMETVEMQHSRLKSALACEKGDRALRMKSAV